MSFLIYFIAFLEGFTTLSIEIIAIRNFTPIIGTSSISTSIILGVILLGLSYGYYIGGKNSKNKEKLSEKIAINLSVSGLFYILFSFIFGTYILTSLLEYSGNYFFSILTTSALIFALPIFLASQTIPLLSEILKGNDTGEKIGKLLFFSTIGSFLGSVLTSSLFFPTIGVEKTAILNSVTLGLLSLLVIFLAVRKKEKIKEWVVFFCIFVFLFSLFALFHPYKKNTIFSKANAYQNIDIYEFENKRIFSLNAGFSSGIDIQTKESFFNYIQEIKKQIITEKDKNILIIGAAGFTLPYELSKEDFTENIKVIDVDPSLKDISEKYFLQEKLDKKIDFKPEPSRYFLHKNKKYFDSIVVDVYVGKSLAPQTLTKEFFNSLKNSGKNIYLNIITDKNLETTFSKNLFFTLKQSWGEVYYKVITEETGEENSLVNIVVTNKYLDGYTKYKQTKQGNIYNDNKNSIENDLFRRNIELQKN